MPDSAPLSPQTGVLIRAENGDVVTYDETGLTLRLSDTVLADLRRRLAGRMDVAGYLGDIDAWDLRADGDWLRFTARLGGLGARGYLRATTGGDILAEAPGPLCAILSIGGARRAGFVDPKPRYPYHVLAPADHIGAVGHEGTATATPNAGLQHIAHGTRDTLIADALLARRYAAGRGLRLFLTRAQTDGAASVAALGRGRAYRNFLATTDSLVLAAKALDKKPQVLAVSIDFGIEHLADATDYAQAMRALLAQIERDLAARGLARPVFLLASDTGDAGVTDHPAMRAQAELAWNHGDHLLALGAPAYAFEHDCFGRPTADALARMAEMDAEAIVALSARQPWFCPLPLLAEAAGNQIRVICRAMGPLVIDDSLGAGPAGGFHLAGAAAGNGVQRVEIAPDDPQALILTCAEALPAEGASLLHAIGGQGGNCSAIRDDWQGVAPAGGAPLHRWAQPAVLAVHPGGWG